MSFSELVIKSGVYAETDIVKKSKKYAEFKKDLDEMELGYENDLNMALYAELAWEEGCGVFEVSYKDKLYVHFYAFKMPLGEQQSQRFYLLWIKLLDQHLRVFLGKKYTIIYYHCLSESLYPYNFLKGIFKKLPIPYYAMLDKLYVVESTFMLRNTVGLLDFGRLNKLYNRKVEYIQSLTELSKLSEIQKNKVLQKIPELLKMEITEKNYVNVIKESKQLKEIRQNSMAIVIPKKITDFLTIELQAHKLTSEGIPLPLAILFDTLRSNIKYLQLEGIFRKSGSIEEEEDIIVEMSKINSVLPLTHIDQHSGFAIAGVVKKFFTKLTTPIVPYVLYDKLLQVLSVKGIKPEEEIQFVKDFLNQLPKMNRKIIIQLIIFLKEEVIVRQDLNKMNMYNMSVCFCPCIFRAEIPSLQDLMYSGKFAGILHILFNRFEQIVGKEERGSRGSGRNSKGNRKSKN